ncbi:collagen alpha-1(XII) chain-like [Octopus bimaculoides]|nr:collagen alpha-1(XII) chain-like [Octopus bimaculoides]
MWLRTLILLTLAISAFGMSAKNKYGIHLEKKVEICKNMKADIVLIIDGSNSIGETKFDQQIEFLKSFVGYFAIGKNDVRFGAVTFGNKVIMGNTFGLSQYTNKNRLEERVSQINFRQDDGSSTQTNLAIKYARETLFKDTRHYAKKIAIVITDGESTDSLKTKEEASEMRKDGIVILAIGVGKNASKEELLTITGKENYVFEIDEYSKLKTIKKELTKLACKGMYILIILYSYHLKILYYVFIILYSYILMFL